jgi:hypothetical protein
MNISSALKQAALAIRNNGRAAANNSNPRVAASNRRRTEKARNIFKMVIENHRLFAFGEVAWITLEGSRGETYSPTLRENGSCVCQCKDSQRGNLCKHRLALAAAVIANASNNR